MLARACAWLAVQGACGRIAFQPLDDARGDTGAGPTVGNRAFVTSTAQPAASLGGVSGADAICTSRASEAGLAGTFVAWVSSNASSAKNRLAAARGWYRIDGAPVVDTADELAAGQMRMPLRLDEHGNDLARTTAYVTTGSFMGMLNQSCGDYTDPTGSATAGFSWFAGNNWSNQRPVLCSDPTHLYCFQIDLVVSLEIRRSTGRRAFVSTAQFAQSSGRAAADAICASEAQSAGLTGTYLALLPEAMPASERFDGSGPPWVRVDGIALAPTANDFLLGKSLAALNLTATGTFFSGLVTTGGPATTAIPTFNCDMWTNASGGNEFGQAAGTDLNAFEQTTGDCMSPAPVYCLEL